MLYPIDMIYMFVYMYDIYINHILTRNHPKLQVSMSPKPVQISTGFFQCAFTAIKSGFILNLEN